MLGSTVNRGKKAPSKLGTAVSAGAKTKDGAAPPTKEFLESLPDVRDNNYSSLPLPGSLLRATALQNCNGQAHMSKLLNAYLQQSPCHKRNTIAVECEGPQTAVSVPSQLY